MLSKEVNKLTDKWDNNTGWKQRLEYIQLKGLRGWDGQRVDFNYPVVAIVGENGSGKSSILQAAASVYRSANPKASRYSSEFFPDTAWDQSKDVIITAGIRRGEVSETVSIRKPTNRWRGNPERPTREVVYLDLARLQPVSGRVGYQRIANLGRVEAGATAFGDERIKRLSNIIGRSYTRAKMATADIDPTREVPVLEIDGKQFSGFHQGAGELTVTELLKVDFPPNSLVLIDEIETSLHPRVQRRIIRDLATLARVNNFQVILTTHSPFVLEELPDRARIQIVRSGQDRNILIGVSPEFAMTKMDEVVHSRADVYVEDDRAKVLVEEVLAVRRPNVLSDVTVSSCGPASVGRSLGQMVAANRFTRPTAVLLDGDQDPAPGCSILPGTNAPEKFILPKVIENNFFEIADRLGRPYADVSAAINRAVANADHHTWLNSISNDIRVPADTIWQTIVSEWALKGMSDAEASEIIDPIEAIL